MNNEHRKFIIFLFLGALLIRFFYLFEMVKSPYFGAPFLDELYHADWAKEIAFKDFIGTKVFFRAPFYSYFLALLFKISRANLFFSILVQHILGAISIIIIYLISLKLFSKNIAILAGILSAAYAPFFYFEGQFLDSFLSVFLYSVSFLTLVNYFEKPSKSKLFITGFLQGLAGITRPNILLFSLTIPLFLYFYHKKSESKINKNMFFSRILLLFISVLLPILPVTIRNGIIGKTFVPIGSYAGINFYVGNNPNADGFTSRTAKHYTFFGRYQDSVELYAQKELESQLDRRLTAREIQSSWFKKGLNFIAKEPVSALKLFFKKAVLFFNTIEIKNNKNIYFVTQYSTVLKILLMILPFSLILSFGVTGILFSMKDLSLMPRRFFLFIAISYLITQAISVIIFFICDRYRIPFIPLLFPFASYSILMFINQIKKRDYNKILKPIVIFILTFIFSTVDWYGVKIKDFSRDYWSVGNCYLEKGDFDSALQAYSNAMKFNPKDPDITNNIGEVYYKLGDLEKARDFFEQTLMIDSTYIRAMNNLGVVFEEKGDLDRAEEIYRKILQVEPEHYLARSNLADTLLKKNLPEQALKEYVEILNKNGDFLNALIGAARASTVLNKNEDAKNYLAKAIKIGGDSLTKSIKNDPLLSQFLADKF